MPALELDRVAVAYDRVPVLSDINGHVMPGHALALIGPNGAGKSTLIRAVLGLAPVTGGTVRVLGLPPAQARGQVAYIPQEETLERDFPVSALDVVLMGRYRKVGWLRRPGRGHREAAMAALDRLDLADRAHVRYGTLSGGQRQRVLLARAIAQEARLLLLDEALNGVDVPSQERLLTVLGELRQGGAAVLLATHDLTLAHLACDHACLLNGRQVGFGPLRETLTSARLREAYGGQALHLHGSDMILLEP